MASEILDFYRSHRAQIEVLADTRSLFVLNLIGRESPNIRSLQAHLGWSHSDLIVIFERLAEAGLVNRIHDLDASINISERGRNLLQILWITTQQGNDGLPRSEKTAKNAESSQLELSSIVDVPEANRDEIFISYSHKDAFWLEELKTTLVPYTGNIRLSIWDDRMLVAGDRWREEIAKHLCRARIAILLVSRYFFASKFITSNELPKLLDAAHREGLKIIWIAVSASPYHKSAIEQYQAANDPQHPLDSLTVAERNAALVNIADLIERVAVDP